MRRIQQLFIDFELWGYDVKGWSKLTRRNYRYRAEAANAWIQEHAHRTLIRGSLG